MEDDSIHRLEGTSNEKGGLVVKKKPPTFKVPQPSLLGLDKLAAAKRKEKEDAARKMSFTIEEDEASSNSDSGSSSSKGKKDETFRKFRAPQVETPTYTGGISEEARTRLLERLASNKKKEKYALYSSTAKEKKSGDNDHKYNKHGKRHEEDYRHSRSKYERRRDRSSHREDTPKFKDEPRTPNFRVKDATSKTAWDDDDPVPPKKSSWDFPTPNIHKTDGDWSERSTKSRIYDDSSRSHRPDKGKRYRYEDSTPRPTPAHKYNAWAGRDRRKTGATPATSRDNSNLKWDATVDRELWEEEQKRLDREWYNLDEGS